MKILSISTVQLKVGASGEFTRPLVKQKITITLLRFQKIAKASVAYL